MQSVAELVDYPPIGNRPAARHPSGPTATRSLQKRAGASRIEVLGRSIDNLLRDRSVGLDDDLLHVLRSLDGLGLVVHPLKLLESSALGLDAGGSNILAPTQ